MTYIWTLACFEHVMQTIAIQKLTEKPSELALYPDFIITSMVAVGPCRVEVGFAPQEGDTVDFVLTERKTGTARVVMQIPSSHFRPALARFAVFSKLDNIYCGHTLFACDFERDGQLRPHRFSLFLCNESAMGYWFRLYLYGIDGLFPLLKKPAG
ncbi:MAG: hypothetical protein ABSD57_10645 [Verrucomicrobiota bacterium]|jgi:hypothetical protein